jgi:hypothetical protein
VNTLISNFVMAVNDETGIRLEAFLKIVQVRNLGPRELEQLSRNTEGIKPKRVSFWSDLINGRKSFGEKLAREVEQMLGLSRGELDRLIGTPTRDFGLLNGFEGQLVTLFRLLSVEEQDALLMEMNNRHIEEMPTGMATAANPYPRRSSKPPPRK